MIGIPLGLLYTNAGEWVFHRYVLHGLGKNKKSFWSFHWHEHHRAARQHDMLDEQYETSVFRWSAKGKEALALAVGAAMHTPLFPVAPFFTATVWWRMLHYYRAHKRSHLDPEWAKAKLSWHYDHHMGKTQNANWCVTHPFFDNLVGTRKRYAYDATGKAMDLVDAVPVAA